MCVTADKAHLSSTIVYAGTTQGGLHVMGYETTPMNLADDPDGANAMLLHIPSQGMTPDMLVDTTGCPSVLRDMAAAAVPPIFATLGVTKGATRSEAFVFKFDVFHIVLASHASQIPAALQRVPPERRVSVNPAQAGFYAKGWRRWSIALCCFNNRDARRAAPIIWAYPSLYPELLFAPGVDDHKGGVPDLDAEVDRDHTVIFATHDMVGGDPVEYTDGLPGHVAGYLPTQVLGRRITGQRPNTDFVAQVSDIRAGRFEFEERLISDAA